MIRMGARGWNQDGTGGEINVYWNDRSIFLLPPSKFSYWLFNAWNRWGLNNWDDHKDAEDDDEED